MATRPGEENVATLFGDVHYFYGPPTARPPHHRFDKSSYIYVFENAANRTARVEIANSPGTDDQDAFEGFLDHTKIRYSYKQQCVVSITVDGVPGANVDPAQWHLPTFDPHNQAKYHYRLHSLDIYFWTQNDALQFVNGVRRLLPPGQIEVADEPAPPAQAHAGFMQAPAAAGNNSLVQKLENMAISDPQYAGAGKLPGPPSFEPPPTSSTPGTAGSGSHQQQQQAPVFVPMAYNPAAPAAPEQITHREKTPPPEDDGHDPLAAAVARDHGVPQYGGPTTGYTSAPPAHPGLPGPPMAPPPQHQQQQQHQHLTHSMTSPGFAPPQFGQLQRSQTMPVVPSAHATPLSSPGLQSPYNGMIPPQPPMPQIQHQHQHHQQPQHTPPLSSPGLPPPPPGGFSQFSYATQPQSTAQSQALAAQQAASVPAQQSTASLTAAGAGASRYGPTGGDWSIHQQVYRPTEQEHMAKHHEDNMIGGKHKSKMDNGQGGVDGKPSRLGQNAERLEKGVTGMLKKFEKKFG